MLGSKVVTYSMPEQKPNCCGLLKVLSRSGVLPILSALDDAPLRFSQLMFKASLNPGILYRHLKSLIELGIVEKDGDYYEITEKGRLVFGIVNELLSIHINQARGGRLTPLEFFY